MLAPVSKMGGKGGKSNFKRLHAYLKEEVTKETGEVIQRGEMVYSDNIMSPETAAAEMRAVAAENKRVGDPVYHYQLAWQEGEKPTREQWEAAAKKSVDALGFKDHQYVIAAHSDTDHFHVHVMVNCVNLKPTGHTTRSFPTRRLTARVERLNRNKVGRNRRGYTGLTRLRNKFVN